MKVMKPVVLWCFLFVALTACADNDEDLVGLWETYKRFGPDVEGPIIINQGLDQAEVGPFVVDATTNKRLFFKHVEPEGGDRLTFVELTDFTRTSFRLPNGLGEFKGRMDDGELRGHWIQPAPIQIGQRMASPVTLTQTESGLWRGKIKPLSAEYTFYLRITLGDEDRLTTFLRNPDRNLGVFTNIRRIDKNGRDLSFLGSFRFRDEERELATGSYDADNDILTMVLPPWRGGSYDFRRVMDDTHSAFHARALNAGAWQYRPPPQLDDGWPTATLSEVGIDEATLRGMIDNEIRNVDDHISSHRVHGILIARHGKLVFEEYFHGFDRNTPHDTRSAAKSLASMLVGAVIQFGLPVNVDTPVYATLRDEDADRDPRADAMTLQHLLAMSSGLYCDDNDYNAPGNENTMQEQTDEPDWYEYTLNVPMAHEPGERGIYCSANTNLIGAVLSESTGFELIDLFSDLLAEPLGIDTYYLGLQPTGEPYLGGGSRWLPRDFMKLGQVMLNGGTWDGWRILSEEWVEASTSPQIKIGDRDYGYQWWINHYPYKDGTVSAFFAAGNGGQIVMGVPELDLLIAFYGGNYSDSIMRRAQQVLIPEYILKAVD
ncbi:MAG: serine hydrolase [Pseudomonadota bacterium]